MKFIYICCTQENCLYPYVMSYIILFVTYYINVLHTVYKVICHISQDLFIHIMVSVMYEESAMLR